MEEEIWKPVPGFEDYLISNYGNIKTAKNKDRALKDKTTRIMARYVYTQLWRNGKSYSKRVHRLVAEAFIPNPKNKSQVNHIDCNKLNNYYGNLEWCTAKENGRHSSINGLVPSGERCKQSQLKKADVIKIRTLYKSGGISQRELSKMYNVCQSTIGYVLRNQTWKKV